jgi:hypothetical protein
MIFIPFPQKNVYSPACSVPPSSHLTSCTPTKANYPEQTCPIHSSDIPCTKSHVHFPLRSFIQGIYPGPNLLVYFRSRLIFYVELEDHLLLAVRDCLFNIFAAALQNWRASPPSATWGRAIPWWQGTHLTWTNKNTQTFNWHCKEVGIEVNTENP